MTAVTVGCTVRELLVNQFGVDAGYVETHLCTVFLNCRSVDDLDAAMVTDGSTLALSSAMPGLVGATLRRGGSLAPMRREITHVPEQPVRGGQRAGTITVKLFNRVMDDLASLFLKRSLIIPAGDVMELLGSLMNRVSSLPTFIHVNDREVSLEEGPVAEALSSCGLVDLRIGDSRVEDPASHTG